MSSAAPTTDTTSPQPARRMASSRARSLAPKEHGAYGQLAFPLCAALAMGKPGLAAGAIAAGAALAFVAHEPLLVLVGQRGPRALREDGPRALRRVAALGTLALGLGAVGLSLAPPHARTASLVPLVLSALLAPFVVANKERTLAGEILAAAALSAASLPVAMAAGVSAALASSAWLAWALVFAASTLAVRAVVAHAKAHASSSRRVSGPLVLAVAATALTGAGILTPVSALGAAPMLAIALVLAAVPPRPTALRRVGWGLVAASAILCVALAVGGHV